MSRGRAGDCAADIASVAGAAFGTSLFASAAHELTALLVAQKSVVFLVGCRRAGARVVGNQLNGIVSAYG